MQYSAMDLVAASLNLMYPGKPYEWIQRAATEMVTFTDRYENPTQEQRADIDTRIRNMCTTGEW